MSSNTKENPIPQEILELAKEIKGSLEADKETGVISTKENTFLSTLPKELTEEQIKASFKAVANFAAASALAVGQKGIEVLKENPSLDHVSSELTLHGKSKISHRLKRKSTGTIDGSQWEKYGDLRTSLELQGISGKSTNMSRIKDSIAIEAEELLK